MSHKRNANKKLNQKKRKGRTSFKPGLNNGVVRFTYDELKRFAGLIL